MSDDLTITVSSRGTSSAGRDIVVTGPNMLGGWEEVEVTLRCEGFPPTFRISTSKGQPLGKGEAIAKGGDQCAVRLGDDLVITGYVNALVESGSATDHKVEITGAGKTMDLVDCEIEWDESTTYFQATTEALTNIASRFGLALNVGAGVQELPVPYPIVLDFGRTAQSYIQDIARAMGVLVFETSEGELAIQTAGTETAASGVVYGQNVEQYSVDNSLQDRFSKIVACYFPQNQYLTGEAAAGNVFVTATDPGVTRNRVKHVFLGQGPEGEAFTKRLALWEVARRAARGQTVRATIDSWRDKAGKLWQPNTLVPVQLPNMTPTTLGLSEVTFRRSDATGTTAELLLMPIGGFVPEPVQIGQDVYGINP